VVRDDLPLDEQGSGATGKCFYPPTDPEELVNRFKSYPKATRMYNSLQEYVEDAAYREQGDPGAAEILLDETEIPEGQKKTTEERHELTIEKVAET
jgi:hypothetical protein